MFSMPKKSSQTGKSSRRVVSLGPSITQDISGVNQSSNGALGVSGSGIKKKGSGPLTRSQYRIQRAR